MCNMVGSLTFLLGVILLSAVVRSGDCGKTGSAKKVNCISFAKKVKSNINDDNFDKLFKVSYKNEEDFKEAVQAAIDAFNQAASVEIPPSISEEVKKEAEKVRSSITTKQQFGIYTIAACRFLKNQGKLTKQNEDKLAKRLAKQFNKAAEGLEDEDALDTFPAITGAVADFFKEEGVYGDQTKLQKYSEYLFAEINYVLDNPESDDTKCTSFVKKVRSNISDDNFNKLFKVSYRNKEDFKKAIQKALGVFSQIAGVNIPKSISQEIKDEAAKVGGYITADQLFEVNVIAVCRFLRSLGKLTRQNEDKLAKCLAEQFNEVAEGLVEGDPFFAFPATDRAVAAFFEKVGLYGDEAKLHKYAEFLISEINKISDNTQSNDSKCTSFAKKVRSNIPDDDYYKLFTVLYKNKKDFNTAVQKAIIVFNQVACVKIPFSISQEIKDEASRVGGYITADQLFEVNVIATCRFLKSLGKLTQQNEDKLAKRLAKQFKKAAEGLEDEDVSSTLSAINSAIAGFFNEEGLYGDQPKLLKFGDYYFSEIDKIHVN